MSGIVKLIIVWEVRFLTRFREFGHAIAAPKDGQCELILIELHKLAAKPLTI